MEQEEAAAEAEAELATNLSDDSGVGVTKSEAAGQEVSNPSDSADSEAAQSPEQDTVSDPPSEETQAKPPPVPAPRLSFQAPDRSALLPAEKLEEAASASASQDTAESGDDSGSVNKVPNTQNL